MKKQYNSRKTSTAASLTTQSLWLCGWQQTSKCLKRLEYQTTLPAIWEIVCRSRSQQLELNMEQLTSLTLGKEQVRAVCHPTYLTDDTTLMAESEEDLKSLFMRVKQESEKNWLKTQHENRNHGIWSHHLMANRWGNNGNSDRLFSWAPKSLQLVAEAMKLKMLAP